MKKQLSKILTKVFCFLLVFVFSCNSLINVLVTYGKNSDSSKNESLVNTSTNTKISKKELKQLRKGILYNLLSKKEKKLYERIYTSIQNMNTIVSLKGIKLKKKNISKVYDYLLSEHPEFFWVNDKEYTVSPKSITLRYINTEKERADRSKLIDEIATECIYQTLRTSLSPIERVVELNTRVSYMEFSVEEDSERDKAGCDDILIDGEGSSPAAFARAFQYLCRKMGFDCLTVRGKINNENKEFDHFFNIVCIDGVWYWVEPQVMPSALKNYVYIGTEEGKKTGCYNDELSGKYSFSDEYKNINISPASLLSDYWSDNGRIYDEKYPAILNEEEISYGDFSFNKLADGTLLLIKYTGENEICNIPEKVKGMEVTYIDEEAFDNELYSLRKVIIPKTIKGVYWLELWEFGSGLTMPDNFEEFEVSADNRFLKSECGALYSKDGTQLICFPPNSKIVGDVIIIPEGVKEVYKFQNRGNKKVIFPGTVEEFEYGAFNDATIDELVISEGTKMIYDGAFQGCDIQKIVLPESLFFISVTAFDFNHDYGNTYIENLSISTKNKEYKVYDNMLLSKNGEKLIYVGKTRYFTRLGGYDYKKLSVPEGVKAIYDLPDCFEVYIPESVSYIFSRIFWQNSGPKKISVSNKSPYFCIYDDALYTKDMKTLVYYFGDSKRGIYIVPDGVETLDGYSFASSKLKHIVLPKTIKNLTGFCLAWTNAEVTVLGDVEYVGCNALWFTDADTVLNCKANNKLKLYDSVNDKNNIKVNVISSIKTEKGDKSSCTVYGKNNKELYRCKLETHDDGYDIIHKFIDGCNFTIKYDNKDRLSGIVESDKKGKKIYSTEYEYDNDRIKKVSYQYSQEKVEYNLDSNGQLRNYNVLSEFDCNADGSRVISYQRFDDEMGSRIYTYDGFGNPLTDESYDSTNELIQSRNYKYEYDNNGNIIRRECEEKNTKDGSVTTTVYNKFGWIQSSKTVNSDGSTSSLVNEYDDDGKHTKRTKVDEDGYTEVTYWDKNEDEYLCETYDPDGSLFTKRETEYYSNGNKSKETMWYSWSNETFVYIYDEFEWGKLLSLTVYDSDGNILK